MTKEPRRRPQAPLRREPEPFSTVPKPDFDRSAPSPEDFAAWCDHPVTRFVAAVYLNAAHDCRVAWDQSSWVEGGGDPELLAELRVRADCYNAFAQTTLENYLERFK